MPQGRSGLSTLTADNMVLDAGEVWFNVGITELEATSWTAATAAVGAVRVGGTRGGNSFSPGRTIREMPVDGAIGPVKGFARRATSRPVLTVNMLELTVANLTNAIAAANSSATASSLTKLVGGEIEDSDYITNVALATTLKGQAHPFVLVVHNALVLDAPEFSFADEDEMVLTVSFVGHVTSAAPNTEAWTIYHPVV
jgi:hypothetical protein